MTVPGGQGSAAFYLAQSQTYIYDVFDQLIGTKTYDEGSQAEPLTDSQAFLNVQGQAVVTYHDCISGAYSDVMIRLYGQGVDTPAAVNWRGRRTAR